MTNFSLQAWALTDFTGIESSSNSSTKPADPCIGTRTLPSVAARLVGLSITNKNDDTAIPDDTRSITSHVARTSSRASICRQNEFAFTDAPIARDTTCNSINDFDGPDMYHSVICFTAGTRVKTADGDRPIETLRPGDLVLTREAGFQPLVRVGSHHIPEAKLRIHRDLAPIRFDPDADLLPDLAQPLLLSPQSRLLHCPPGACTDSDRSKSLALAKSYINGSSIRSVIPDGGVTYVDIMCAEPQLICTNGIWAETQDLTRATSTGMVPHCKQATETDLTRIRSRPDILGDDKSPATLIQAQSEYVA